MNEIVKVSDDDVELVSTEKQITAAVAEAEVRFELLQKISVIALKRTFPQDWIDLGGRPYLTAPGAERIRPLFRIAITDMESKRFESHDGGKPRYMYVVSGTAHFRDDDFAVLGTCSSTDQFFSSRRDAQGQSYTLPADQVNEENIIKSAYSDLVRGAVVRVLGLRNLTWDQLEALGFDRSKAPRVQFRSGGARGGAAAPATGTSRAVTREAPSIPAAPPEAPANGQNGGTPGVGPEVQALQQAITATTGEPYDAPASLSLLQSCTAFKDYVGTRDWTRVRPQAALVAIERLRKAREKQVLQQSQQTPLGQ